MQRLNCFCVSIALAVGSAHAGTLFDEDGNKIETCKGSTCVDVPGGTGGEGTPGSSLVIKPKISARVESKSRSISSSNATSRSSSKSRSVSSSQADSYSGGNALSQEVTINGALAGSSGGTTVERQVGIAPDVAAVTTAPCRIGVGGSGGWLQGVFGFTFGLLDEGCDTWRDTVGLAEVLKRPDAAIKRACQKPEIAEALGVVECPKKDNATQVSAGSPSPHGWGH